MKLRGIYYDIFITFLTEFFVLTGFFVTYRLLAGHFGAEGVGEYSLVKRAISLFQPFLFLGLAMGLSRYLAVTRGKAERVAYLQAGAYTILFFSLIFIFFVNLFRQSFALLVFGSIDYERLVGPFSMLLAGFVLHGFVYTYFRGFLKVKVFNVLQIINLALVPIAVITVFHGKNIETIIYFIGIWVFLVGLIFLSYFLKDMIKPVVGVRKSFKELMLYGLPRFGGDLILAGFFSLGPIFAAHVISIKEVGYLSISQSLLSSACAFLAPLGLVLLPRVSNLIAEGREDLIKKNISLLGEAVIQCSIYLCVQLICFSDIIIKYWLGMDFIEAIPVMQIMFLSLVFYNFYVAFRSILDAVNITPINTINLGISSVFFIGFIFLAVFQRHFSVLIGLSLAFTMALACLGLLTYYSIRKIYLESMNQVINGLKVAVQLNILTIGLTLAVKPLIGGNIYILFIYELILGLTYLFVLYLRNTKWVLKAKSALLNQ
jgi:O-antigen/teichoic acid export membrane protein